MFKKYDAYKDSGVDWIGSIPTHWNVLKLGSIFEQRNEKVSDQDYPALSVTKNGIVPQLDNAAKTKDGDNRKLVLEGDFVINSRSDRKGSSGLSSLDGSVSLINIVLKPRKIEPKFSHHLMKCNAFIEEYYRVGRGIVADLWTTRFEEMKTMNLALPNIEEQRKITEFLDQKTSEIDQAIAIKQQQIALLNELRQIVIQKAMTQGLDPNVPMKDSGVEWIGAIPEHWQIKKIKHVAGDFMYGTSVECNTLSSGTPVLRIPNIDELYVNFDDLKFTQLSKSETENYSLKQNDILVIRTNGNPELVGKSALIRNLDREFLFASYLIRVKPKKLINPEFLICIMNSSLVRKALTNGARTSVGNYNLNTQTLGNCFLTLPPLEEQLQILNFIRSESQKFDDLININAIQIKKLKEYKTTLISDAVTGKIKVA
ncbi:MULTISPECIES: restriction endonuclease subunit S [Acinetobacter calcoaceticus/baumannii complex]|uniref:restriction endonuclease subunit S n=1 Tax=Acinetobacter calcoaceticus/baumannii complex TaxID=909768 RepID=UPI0032B50BDD